MRRWFMGLLIVLVQSNPSVFAKEEAGPDSTATVLRIAEHKHIWGGDEVQLNVTYGGLVRLGIAWSGRVHALSFYDGPNEGRYIIFIDDNGNIVSEPHLLDKSGDANWIFWSGEKFLVLCSNSQALVLKKFTEEGEFESERTLLNYDLLSRLVGKAIFSNGSIYFIARRVRVFDGVSIYCFSSDGEQNGNPLWVTTRGEVGDAVLFGDRWGFLSGVATTFHMDTIQFFALNGRHVSVPIDYSRDAYGASIGKSGNNLFLLWQHVTQDKLRELRARLYNPDGILLTESPGISLPDMQNGSANYTCDIIPGDRMLLGVLDTNVGKDVEDVYAQLFDNRGQPLGELTKLNPRPLEQVDHCAVYTEDGFSVFTVEKGAQTSSIEWFQLELDSSSLLPTLLQNERPPAPTPVPHSPQHAPKVDEGRVSVLTKSLGVCHLHFCQDRIWYESEDRSELQETLINGEVWMPEDGKRHSCENPGSPMPSADGYAYWLDYVKSPGLVMIEQLPNTENAYELVLLLQLNDMNKEYGHEFVLCWSNNPPPSPTPFPKPNLYLRGGISSVLVQIHGNNVSVFDRYQSPIMPTPVVETSISDPLPDHAVDISVQVIQSAANIQIFEQPRLENDYTASISIKDRKGPLERGYHEMVFQWGGQIEEAPTATPWPTWAPGAPPPTPVKSGAKVLWLAKKVYFSETRPNMGDDWLMFRNIIGTFGVAQCELPSFPDALNCELLQKYDVIIFGPSDRLVPLSLKEQEAVVDFVRNGGSILIAPEKIQFDVEEISPTALYASSITEPFGIRYSKFAFGDRMIFEPQHRLNLNGLVIMGKMSKLLLSGRAQAVASYDTGNVVLACAEDGYGRVVAITDHTAFSSKQLSAFNEQLGYNVGAWLLRQDDFVLPTPTPKPIRKQRSPGLWDQIVESFKKWH